MTNAASSITQSSTTSASRLAIDCTIRRPRPGSTKTFSTTMAPAIEVGELQPHDGQDRRHRVGQGVAPERGAPRQALGARGADEVLVERLEQRRARHPRQDRGLHQPERDRRQDQRAERAPRIRPQPGKPPAGARRQCTAKIEHEHDARTRNWERRARSGSPPSPRRRRRGRGARRRRRRRSAPPRRRSPSRAGRAGALTASLCAISGPIGES